MNSFFRKREEEDDQIQNDIQNIFRDLNKYTNHKHTHYLLMYIHII